MSETLLNVIKKSYPKMSKGHRKIAEYIIEHYKTIGVPSYDNINEILSLVGLNNTQNKQVKYFYRWVVIL